MNFSITKDGKALDPSLYTWDSKRKTLSTTEAYLVLDFRDWDGCTFNTGDGCRFYTWKDCTFNTGDGCRFYTWKDCTFNTGDGCIVMSNFNNKKNMLIIEEGEVEFKCTEKEWLFNLDGAWVTKEKFDMTKELLK